MNLPSSLRAAVVAAVASLALGAAHANLITLTFSTTDAAIAGGPSSGVDLTIVFTADTANYHATGSAFGGGFYDNLTGIVSSTALGLSNVQTTGPLQVVVGLPVPFGAPDTVGIYDGTQVAGMADASFASWNGVSNLSALGLQARSTDTLTINLLGGGSVNLITFEAFVDRRNDANFTAVLQTTTTVPEPAPLALVGLALAGLALQRRGHSAG